MEEIQNSGKTESSRQMARKVTMEELTQVLFHRKKGLNMQLEKG